MRLEEDNGHIKHSEIDFFIKGNVNIGQKLPNRPFAWLPENTWKDLNQLASVIERFKSVTQYVSDNEELWKNVIYLHY